MKTKNEILAEIKFSLIKEHNIDILDDALINDCVEMTLKAINYNYCCTELPNKMVIELSDEEMQIVSIEELIQMEKEAMEFDGFKGWIVRGKAGIIK